MNYITKIMPQKKLMAGFSGSLFHEVRDYGIKVSTIFPNSVDAESHISEKSTDFQWKITPKKSVKPVSRT